MDETLRKISERLTRKRQELERHVESTAVWESTTAELLDRVQRLKTRLTSAVSSTVEHDKK